MPRDIRISDGHGPESVSAVRALFREYADWLGEDLCFQGFDAELAELPGKYAPPRGAILLAHVDSQLAGCVALRPLDAGVCEMKRLWLREGFRGMGLGRRLITEIMERGRRGGYDLMRLDTLRHMKSALATYAAHGFHEIPVYYDNPMPDVVYLEARLRG